MIKSGIVGLVLAACLLSTTTASAQQYPPGWPYSGMGGSEWMLDSQLKNWRHVMEDPIYYRDRYLEELQRARRNGYQGPTIPYRCVTRFDPWTRMNYTDCP
jgi:hypothetical protein